MPNKNKNKSNSYSVFVNAMRPQVEAETGKKMTFDEISEYVGPKWKNMSAEERKNFKPEKKKVGQLDCYGVPVALHEKAIEEQLQYDQEMTTGISHSVKMHANAMKSFEFVTISMSHYLKTQDDIGDIFPSEISIVKTSLGGGLNNDTYYHTIVMPLSKWPLGFDAELRGQVANTHKIPYEVPDHQARNTQAKYYDDVASDIDNFLLSECKNYSELKYTPVYVLEEDIPMIRNILDKQFGLGDIRVWSLERLLRELYVHFKLGSFEYYSPQAARDNLVNNTHALDYDVGIACPWHRNFQCDEVNFCTLNKARRWCFLLLKTLAIDATLKLAFVEGQHWPHQNPLKAATVQYSDYCKKKNSKSQRSFPSVSSLQSALETSLESKEPPKQMAASKMYKENKGHWDGLAAHPEEELNTRDEASFPSLGASSVASKGDKRALKVNRSRFFKQENTS